MAQRELSNQTRRKLILACVIAVAAPFIFVGITFCVGERWPIIIVPWSAGDALTCSGALSAACVAIYGVYCTLWDNRIARAEQVRQDRIAQEDQLREAAAPYFSAVFLEQEAKRTLVDEMLDALKSKVIPEEPIASSDYREVERCKLFVIMGDEIRYSRRLDESQSNRVKSTLGSESGEKGVTFLLCNPVIFIPLKMLNTGPGAASSVRVGVNRDNGEDNHLFASCSFVLDHGEGFYLGIYVDTSRKKVSGNYIIEILYSDTLGYQYKQSFKLNVIDSMESKGHPRVDVAYVGSRELLSKCERQSYLETTLSVESNERPAEDS